MSSKEHLFEGRIKEFEKIIIEYTLATGRMKSVSPNTQLVLGYLAIHRKLTQKQLRDLTGLSAGTVSKHLRSISKYGIIEKRLNPGTNEKYYEMALLSQLSSKMAEISSQEFVEMIEFFRERLIELKRLRNKKGQQLLSERLMDLIETFQTIVNISSDLVAMLRPKK